MGAPVTLLRSCSVLDLTSGGAAENQFVWFHGRDDGEGMQRRAVALVVEDWVDMGHPQQITVTVEPGDRLNEEA